MNENNVIYELIKKAILKTLKFHVKSVEDAKKLNELLVKLDYIKDDLKSLDDKDIVYLQKALRALNNIE